MNELQRVALVSEWRTLGEKIAKLPDTMDGLTRYEQAERSHLFGRKEGMRDVARILLGTAEADALAREAGVKP